MAKSQAIFCGRLPRGVTMGMKSTDGSIIRELN
jgi:hypothetical protein